LPKEIKSRDNDRSPRNLDQTGLNYNQLSPSIRLSICYGLRETEKIRPAALQGGELAIA
jgi:hypothetical protein